MNHYLRIFPPKHPFGNPKLWCWEVCSMNDVAVSGTSDDWADCMDIASSALLGVMEEAKHEHQD